MVSLRTSSQLRDAKGKTFIYLILRNTLLGFKELLLGANWGANRAIMSCCVNWIS